MFEAYGAYKSFDHEPTQEEVREAAHVLVMEMAHLLEKDAVICTHLPGNNGNPGKWTVGVKFFLPKKSRHQRLDNRE